MICKGHVVNPLIQLSDSLNLICDQRFCVNRTTSSESKRPATVYCTRAHRTSTRSSFKRLNVTLALPGINDRIVDQTMSLSTSSLAFEKYTGGTAQDIVLFLHWNWREFPPQVGHSLEGGCVVTRIHQRYTKVWGCSLCLASSRKSGRAKQSCKSSREVRFKVAQHRHFTNSSKDHKEEDRFARLSLERRRCRITNRYERQRSDAPWHNTTKKHNKDKTRQDCKRNNQTKLEWRINTRIFFKRDNGRSKRIHKNDRTTEKQI